MSQIQQQEEELKQLQSQLDELLLEKHQLLEKKKEIEEKNSIQSMKKLLQEDNNSLETQCSLLIQKLQNKEITLNEFNNQYIQLRYNLHFQSLLLTQFN